MNQILPTPINEKKVTKTLLIFMAVLCLAPILLNILLIAPIYSIMYSNVQYQNTILLDIIRYVMDLFDILAFTSAYALLIYSFTLLKKKAKILVTLSYIGILILKMPLKLLMEQILNHSINSARDLVGNLMLLIFYFVIELLQFFTVFLIASVVSRSYLRSVNLLGDRKKNKSLTKIEPVLPIKRVVNRYNPLLRSALYASLVVIAFRILTQLITDIELGAPESITMTIILIVLYVSNLIYGVITYFISILVFNFSYKFMTSEKSKKGKATENGSTALPEDLST